MKAGLFGGVATRMAVPAQWIKPWFSTRLLGPWSDGVALHTAVPLVADSDVVESYVHSTTTMRGLLLRVWGVVQLIFGLDMPTAAPS